MTLEQQLSASNPAGSARDPLLESLVHGKSRILNQKLKILAAEMNWRLYLADRNLGHIQQDRETTRSMLQRIDRDALYHLRDHQEKAPLYRKLFEIEADQRRELDGCWRDVTQTMRDFLDVWEAKEQARSKAMLLSHHVGSGTQEPL